MIANTKNRKELRKATCDQYESELDRKRKQGELRLFQRRWLANGIQKQKDTVVFPVDQWLSLTAAVSFIVRAKEDLQMSRMTAEERQEHINKQGAKGANSRWAKEAMQESLRKQQMLKILDDPADRSRVQFLADVMRAHWRIKERRAQTKKLVEALSSWKLFGRMYMQFKAMTSRVIKLQRFFRRFQARLHHILMKVSHRWERLERAELAKELNKADPLPKAGAAKKGAVPPPKLSLEEKIQLELIDESTRNRFILNELRARRYRLLPDILVWEDELNQWNEDREAHRKQREAHEALGIEPPETNFRWPPCRPSHLFPERDRKEEGDEQILDLWRTARASKGQGGWSEIEQQDVPAGQGRQVPEQKESTRPFGEADDSELIRWGADPAAMPGLTMVHAQGPRWYPAPC